MGAAEADQKLPDARVKAAAWAWYQRGGGSIVAGTGRSEVFATRCNSSPAPSRFQREAAVSSRNQAFLGSDGTLFSSSSSMDNLSGSVSSLSCGTTVPGDIVLDGPEESMFAIVTSAPHEAGDCLHGHATLDLVSMDSAAFWDCGSSLFDSFELVAMSKKLDSELHEPSIDAQLADCLQPLGSVFGDQEPKLLLCDATFTPTSPPSVQNEKTFDVFDKLLAATDTQSKQAVYDMFCHYGNAEEHIAKQPSKRSPPTADTVCGGETGKHKTRQGRLSFQALAKALYNIRRLHSHAISGSGGDGDGAESMQEKHHRHHLHYKPHPQSSAAGKPALKHGHGGSMRIAMPLGEPHVCEDMIDGAPGKSRHVHHHHHHHYHYLFHSDDDYRLQPPDKSLMVAAAGLRSFKSAPALSNYLEPSARGDSPIDLGGKLAEFGSVPSPNSRY